MIENSVWNTKNNISFHYFSIRAATQIQPEEEGVKNKHSHDRGKKGTNHWQAGSVWVAKLNMAQQHGATSNALNYPLFQTQRLKRDIHYSGWDRKRKQPNRRPIIQCKVALRNCEKEWMTRGWATSYSEIFYPPKTHPLSCRAVNK